MMIRLFGLGVLLLATTAAPAMASDTVVQGAPRAIGGVKASPVETRDGPERANNSASRKRNDGSKTTSTSDPDDSASDIVAASRSRTGNLIGKSTRLFDVRFDEGMAAIREKNPGRAVELMKPLLADFEKQYAGEKRQIFCAVTPEQSSAYLADAAKAKREAIAIEAAWCRAQYIRGFALIDLGKLDEALEAFQGLTALAPKNSRYLNELGYVLSRQKKWTAAVDVFTRSAAFADLSPDDMIDERCAADGGLGSSLMELGRLNEAEAAFRKCLELRPGDKNMLDALDALVEERKQTV